MKYIISANYLNRESEYHWLVRREDQTPHQATACKSVVAKHVRFQTASSVESALGCASVAVTEEAPLMEGAFSPESKADAPAAEVPTPAAEADPVHNPRDVPADKVPEGYRFARRSEIDGVYHAGSMFWNEVKKEFEINSWSMANVGKKDGANHTEFDTIIVPIAPVASADEVPAAAEPLPALTKVEYRSGQFHAFDTGARLDSVKELHLKADGEILAVL